MIRTLYDSEFSTLEAVGSNCIYITFKGFFSKRECESLMEQLNECCEENGDRRFIQVWDCQHMTRFEMEAKNAWQQMLSKRSDQISEIYLIADKTMFKLAGKLMGLIIKIPMKVISSAYELPRNIQEERFLLVS